MARTVELAANDSLGSGVDPSGFCLPRLVMPELGSDDWMDAQLRNVPLPAGLLSRLADPAQYHGDHELDGELLAVAVPNGLTTRLKRLGRPVESWPRWLLLGLFILAALAMLAIGTRTDDEMGLHKPERVATQQAR